LRALIVTAVEAERAALRAVVPPQDEVIAAGAGPAAAAAAAAATLAVGRFDLVISAGVAGGVPPVAVAEVAVASAIVFADLGAETVDGFLGASGLGFGIDRYEVAPRLARTLAERSGGRLGTIATVATATGTSARAAALRAAHPDIVAEAMEGAGVAAAGSVTGVPFAEIRAVSNLVGPRDRGAWRITEALAALAAAVAQARKGELPL